MYAYYIPLSQLLVNYRFTTCGNNDREGPTYMNCTEYYCNSGSPVCGHLLNEGTSGSQMFVVPRSGNYTVTIAGGSGGHGVCSNHSGLGVIAKETFHFRRGEILRILVGQQGTNVCDGHEIDGREDVVCHTSNDKRACETLWNEIYSHFEFQIYDGGGGGGGASLIEYKDSSLNDGDPIVIAPGGGGSGAIYNVTSFLSTVNITYDDTDYLEALYKNFTYGHAFKTFSEKSDGAAGTFGVAYYANAAGPGAGYTDEGYRENYVPLELHANALSLLAYGGIDCVESVRIRELPFPDTHGGFGGGGGGCEGGGGGGGYTGGSILGYGTTIPGEGGYSWPDPPWPLVGYNDGDGYVELFLESCGCTYNCVIYNQSSFECSCPSNTLLALNGFDCYTEGRY